ncbi:hypothetical protein M153_4850001445 [Pseudoloma neurophilia]|uniref:Uncharacterized protein n=1 Tax=Pseudoloma neurophilia TaxID=146866 RepID=A0A0R0LXR5_9MICR|nr:hypothetical protein M153_4850001445 [Pseudoloma neurophilia]
MRSHVYNLFFLFLVCLCSCSDDKKDTSDSDDGWQVCRMPANTLGEKINFDDNDWELVDRNVTTGHSEVNECANDVNIDWLSDDEEDDSSHVSQNPTTAGQSKQQKNEIQKCERCGSIDLIYSQMEMPMTNICYGFVSTRAHGRKRHKNSKTPLSKAKCSNCGHVFFALRFVIG